MVRIEEPDGHTMFDDYADLRGDANQKNIEKAHGPNAQFKSGGFVRRCPICNCVKSFEPEVPNKVLYKCDGDCPCHDNLVNELRYATA